MTEGGPSCDNAEPRANLAIEVVRHGGAWADNKISDALVERAAHAAFTVATPQTQTAYDATIVLTDDTEMTHLNRAWRGKDATTNVLSFPAGDVVSEPGPLGDIVIAFETTQKEADDENTAFADHVSHLVVHGVLHLLGLDHMQDDEAERMETLETRALASIGVTNPYECEPETSVAEVAP
jgi:probable rRNA maturation factor